MLYKTGSVSISPTVAEWQATQKCVTDRHKIFPLTAIAPILNGGWGQINYIKKISLGEAHNFRILEYQTSIFSRH